MVTVKDFRRMALGLQGAEEHAHMGHPDFRAWRATRRPPLRQLLPGVPWLAVGGARPKR